MLSQVQPSTVSIQPKVTVIKIKKKITQSKDISNFSKIQDDGNDFVLVLPVQPDVVPADNEEKEENDKPEVSSSVWYIPSASFMAG